MPTTFAVLVAVALASPPVPASLPLAAATGPVPAREAPREIAALLSLLRVSPCRFERNGRWYDGERAADHLQRKYDYVVGRGREFASAEQFIEAAATRSSFTGRPYRVRCGEAAAMPARDWFLARLATLRPS